MTARLFRQRIRVGRLAVSFRLSRSLLASLFGASAARQALNPQILGEGFVFLIV
jgi:hypothetical protein